MVNVHSKQRGAVSIFVVIFAALLIVMTATAFVRIMLQDQMQATKDDLSRSALDSANAGVEDAKRLLVKFNKECVQAAGPNCGTWRNALNGEDCDALHTVLGLGASGSETAVGSDSSLQQAYTCVTVELDTIDYVGSLAPGVSQFIRLKGVGDFTQVKIDWYSKDNLQASNVSTIRLDADPARPDLAARSSWPANTPSVLRAQFMQFGASYALSSLDASDPANDNNASTIFMMPVTDSRLRVPLTTLNFNSAAYASPLQPVRCYADFTTSSNDPYACSVTIGAGDPDDSANPSATVRREDAYLRLNAPYNDTTHYRIQLLDASGGVVRFAGVQPRVDSTGRANDLFRRIVSRIEPVGNDFPFVEGALDVTGDLCKAFSVSSTTFTDSTTCPIPR